MDVQPPIADLGGPTLLERLADGAAAARAAGVAVIYVKVGFRPGYPEIGPRANAMLTRIKEVGAFVDGASAEVHRVLTEKIFPSQAQVMTVREWTTRAALLAGGSTPRSRSSCLAPLRTPSVGFRNAKTE
jgi:nicotinamidase-related amidase